MTLSTAPVVGVPNQEHWPQVFQHRLDEHTLFVATFCVSDKDPQRKKGHRIVEELQKLPFDHIAELSTELQSFQLRHTHELESFAAMHISDTQVFAWSWKWGRVSLIRKEKKGTIVSSDVFKVVSGAVHPDDIFVISTAVFADIVPLRELITEGSVEDIADQGVIAMQKDTRQAESAAYILRCGNVSEWFSHQRDTKTVEPLEEPLPKPLHPTIKSKVDEDEVVTATTAIPQPIPTGEVDDIQDEMLELNKENPSGRMPQLTTFFRKFASTLQPLFLRGIKINGDSRKNRRTLIMVAAAVALILISFILISFQVKKRNDRVAALKAPYVQQLQDAKAAQTTDVAVAREKTRTLLDSLKSVQSTLKKKSYEETQISNLLGEVQKYYDSISGEQHLASLQPFFNFQLVKSVFVARRAAIQGNKATFIDTNGSAIQLDLTSKQSSIVEVNGLSSLRDVAVGESGLYFLGTGEKGLGIYKDGTPVSPALTESDNPTLLKIFGTSAYVYQRDLGELMRYPDNNGTFGEGIKWLKNSQGLERNTVVSMTIDGQIWLTTNKGGIFTFAQGNKKAFSVQGLNTTFNSSIVLYTTADLNNLYILEPAQQRIVVLTKEGVYVKQIISKEIAAATDILVSEDGKTAYILAGSVVYSVSLE